MTRELRNTLTKKNSENLEEMVRQRNKEVHVVQKELETILDNVPGLIFYKDTENNYLRVNKAIADAHNMSKKDLIGKNLTDLYPAEVAQAYWRSKPLNLQNVTFSDIIQKIITQIKIPSNIHFENRILGKSSIIRVDPTQISQVLENLMSNAIHAMPDGGELVLSLETEDQNMSILSLKDSGEGISKENLKQLFEPLFTTKAKGIGLGLAISKTIIENHKGSIEVTSKLGQGSIFRIKLPIFKQHEGK